MCMCMYACQAHCPPYFPAGSVAGWIREGCSRIRNALDPKGMLPTSDDPIRAYYHSHPLTSMHTHPPVYFQDGVTRPSHRVAFPPKAVPSWLRALPNNPRTGVDRSLAPHGPRKRARQLWHHSTLRKPNSCGNPALEPSVVDGLCISDIPLLACWTLLSAQAGGGRLEGRGRISCGSSAGSFWATRSKCSSGAPFSPPAANPPLNHHT